MNINKYRGKRISIAFVILDPGFGGGHRHVLDLATNLSKRFESVVISSSREMLKAAEQRKLTSVALPSSRFFGFEDVKPLRMMIGRRKWQLVHAHGPRAGFVSALACLGLRTNDLGLPLVYTDHAWNPDYVIAPLNAALQLAGLRLVCRAADKVIAVSQKSGDFLVGRGIAKPEKVVVIPNGIDLSTVYGRQSTARGCSRKTVDSRPTVGSVGAFNRRKGHDIFVAAIPHVLAKNPKVRFAIIGDGPEKLNVEKQTVELGVRRFIHFAGWLGDKERDAERRKWTVYVQSSRDESFGIAAAEALAMGIPVVATNVGGLPEVVDGGGLIVEKENPQALADAILKLLGNKKLRDRLARIGQEHVRKNYDLKKVVGKIENSYHELLERTP